MLTGNKRVASLTGDEAYLAPYLDVRSGIDERVRSLRRLTSSGEGLKRLDAVLPLIEAQCRAWGASELEINWRRGRGTPEPFYLARGFEPFNEDVLPASDALPEGDVVVEARKRL